jgi:hypothetical protein
MAADRVRQVELVRSRANKVHAAVGAETFCQWHWRRVRWESFGVSKTPQEAATSVECRICRPAAVCYLLDGQL